VTRIFLRLLFLLVKEDVFNDGISRVRLAFAHLFCSVIPQKRVVQRNIALFIRNVHLQVHVVKVLHGYAL
jgi:hypothetical protein